MPEDKTYTTVSFEQRVILRLAELQAQLDAQAQSIHKLSERQDHADAWLHKLLNPTGDGVPAVNTPALFDHEDGI